jgi:hypothetical protein
MYPEDPLHHLPSHEHAKSKTGFAGRDGFPYGTRLYGYE